jgi:SNF2 family DNA or RNA helicase
VNNKYCRVFIGNIEAAGTGIDGLQKSACEVAFLEQDWVPSRNAQAIMRVHRCLQERPVRVRIFTMRKSSDELVQDTLMRKARELTKIF